MGCARYIGRVGALAVALGVGVALATTPGIAYADPSGEASTSPADPSSPAHTDAPSGAGTADVDAAEDVPADEVPAEDDPADDPEQDGQDTEAEDTDVEDTDVAGTDVAGTDVAGTEAEDTDVEDPTEVQIDEDAAPTDAEDDVDVQGSGNGDANRLSSRSTRVPVVAVSNVADSVEPMVTADKVGRQPQIFSLPAVDDVPAPQSFAAFSLRATSLTSPDLPPAVALPKTLVGVVSDLVASVLQPLLTPGNGSPTQLPILTAVLALMRNEFERILAPGKANPASQIAVTELAEPSAVAVDPAKQRVLVIGVDGTNLSRILADPGNENFAALLADSTTAPSSIVGHTTISDPSWTAILTGVWGERTGVINNVFTPWTYDEYPTVFNQLETLNPDIDTTAIGNWDVINAIAGAGSNPVDENIYVGQIAGDTNWLATDDDVAVKTIDAITSADGPTFIYSYYVGVDENGHMYGGDSPEYAAAIENMDDNLGDIMAEVNAWNAAHPDDQWTVIVVTDHGHQPQVGFGHGFQSPDETETFVIANGPDFKDGYVNLQYEIVDVTPTVVTLFGGSPVSGSDGVSLTTLGGGDVEPVDLTQALQDAIAMNGYPDIATNVALGLRTIFATIPYYVFTTGIDAGAAVPSFLVVPVQVVFDSLYVITNVPAQIVALLTGVSGASIFPLLPPPAPDFTPAEQSILQDFLDAESVA